MVYYRPWRGPSRLADQRKWLGLIEDQLEVLIALSLAAYPEESAEHRRAMWTGIRLRVFLKMLHRTLEQPFH